MKVRTAVQQPSREAGNTPSLTASDAASLGLQDCRCLGQPPRMLTHLAMGRPRIPPSTQVCVTWRGGHPQPRGQPMSRGGRGVVSSVPQRTLLGRILRDSHRVPVGLRWGPAEPCTLVWVISVPRSPATPSRPPE